MSLNDVAAVVVLFVAYGVTWVLFVRSLRVVSIIHKEKLQHMGQIRDRLKERKPSPASDGKDK